MPYVNNDDDDEVRDGETVHVPLHMMDAMQRAIAGHDFGARTAARARWVKQLNDAWRTPGRDANPPQFTCPECHGTGNDPDADSPSGKCDECGGTGYISPPTNSSSREAASRPKRAPDTSLRVSKDAATTVRRAAYDDYCRRLTDAWRTPHKDAAEPEAATQLLHPDPYSGVQAPRRPVPSDARERAWNSYKNQLGNAWQQGRTDPQAATAIEQQAEKWRHGK
jgi:hypothetical protein